MVERGDELECYRTLVETVGDPMYMLDADGTVTMANQASARELGYDDPAALEGEDISAFMAPGDAERGSELLVDLVESDREWATFETDVLVADGQRRRMENKIAPLTEDGKLVGSVGVVRDISDRKAREEALRELTEQIERLQSFLTDLQGAETAEDVYDLAIEASVDILGLDWCATMEPREGWLELVAVSEAAPVDVGDRHLRVDEGSAGKAYQTGTADIVHDVEREDKGKPADESIRSGLSVPIGDRGVFQATAGQPDAFDQNDRELAELLTGHVNEALRRIDRERELRALAGKVERLHHVTTSMQSCATANEIYELVVDAAEDILAFDWAVVAVATEGWLELAAVSENAPLEAGGRHLRVDEGVAGEVYRTGESRLVARSEDDPDADPVADSVAANITVKLGEYGVFQAVAAEPDYFDEDDLELAETLGAHASEALRRVDRERELRRQNDRLERFASVVSHDLRNPLNVARGYAETVDDDAAREIKRSLDRMEAIVADVLELARQGRTIDDPAPVPLADAAGTAWANVATGDATLAATTDAIVRADEGRLVGLLENLFHNAVEHGDATTVAVAAEPDAGRVAVADDGSGIPADKRETVFELGYTTSEDGTGFGLTIVAEIADAHGWEVAATDPAVVEVVDGDAFDGACFVLDGVERATDR